MSSKRQHGVWQFNNPQYQQMLRKTGIGDLKSKNVRILEPRFQIIIACFLATLTAYIERTGFSIAYTAMASTSSLDESIKGTVLSSFYWGYGLSQIPGGWAAQHFGGEHMLTISFLLWSIASFLTPGSASNTNAIILARICVGVAQGFLIPAVHTVLSHWIPPPERARAVSLTTSGMYLGSAAAMQVLPGIAARFGPSALLKLVGMLGMLWTFLWRMTLIRVKRAARHSQIPIANSTSEEKQQDFKGSHKQQKKPAPWQQMILHPAVWAIVINNFTFHYSFYVVMNWLPTYFDKILQANLATLGVVKTLPYITMFVASNAGGWAGDYLINIGRRSVAGGRKVVNTIGFWSGTVALMLMPTATSVTIGVLYTTMVLGSCGFARGGFSVNHMDIAPKYAGLVMYAACSCSMLYFYRTLLSFSMSDCRGISNTAGTLSGVIGVAVTGYLLQWAGGADKVAGWNQSFALAAIQGIAGSIFFILFARGERLFGSDTAADYG